MVDDGIRPEDHLRLAAYVTVRTLRRPTEDDFAEARLALVEAAAEWNAGKRPCQWSTFAGNAIRWKVLHRFALARADVEAREVDLFLPGEDEDDERERPELAVDDAQLAAAGDRVDAVALLEKLYPHARRILARRFGIVGEPATRAQVARELGITEGQLQRRERAALAVLGRIARRGRRRPGRVEEGLACDAGDRMQNRRRPAMPAHATRDRATLPQ